MLQDIRLSLPGVAVRRLRLNRHSPESHQWSEHQHEDHAQLLIYLTGRGRQKVADAYYDCRPGTVIYVAPDTPHAFDRKHVREPLCLVLDVELERTRSTPYTRSQLPAAHLSAVRAVVSRLFLIRHLEGREVMLQVGAHLLEILDKVLLCIGWLKPVNRFGSVQLTTTHVVERVIENHDTPETTLAELAKRAGYQQDYLNRLLKAECGLTLGQLRSRHRLETAQKLLVENLPVQTVAERVGMLDNNYFSRWFKQQTGVSPSQWKKNPKIVRRF